MTHARVRGREAPRGLRSLCAIAVLVSACATPIDEPAPPLVLVCRPDARLVTPVAPDPITQEATQNRYLNLHSIPPVAVGVKCAY